MKQVLHCRIWCSVISFFHPRNTCTFLPKKVSGSVHFACTDERVAWSFRCEGISIAALLQNWNSRKYEYSMKSYDTRKYIVYLRNVEFDVAESGSTLTTVRLSPET